MARYKLRARYWIREYFTFSKWQRRAIVAFLFIIVASIVFPALYERLYPQQSSKASPVVLQKVDELVAWQQKDSANNDAVYSENWREPARQTPANTAEYFLFDPNTASAEDWQKLGLRPKTAQTILKYRSKGGRFRKPEDLLKIYGLPPQQAQQLIPWVRIAAVESEKPFYRKDSFAAKPSYTKNVSPIDINLADTSAWIGLPGIGSKLAARIVNFREKLGGFYSIQQVGETYALPDSTFQKIKPRLVLSNNQVRTININTADAAALKAHPYISWNIANAIVQYRNQHGVYASPDDLRRIVIIDESLLNKLRPYLAVQ